MTVTISTDQAGRNPKRRVEQRSGREIVRGRSRSGIQAADFAAEAVHTGHPLAVRVEKPRVLIETARVEGVDLLTAKDIALHEYMIAHARKEGIQIHEHEVEVGSMLGFLGVREIARLEESLSRLSRTVIRYDVTDIETGKRIKTWPQMITLALEEDLKSGASKITYSLPKPLRTAMLQNRDYALLDLNVLPRLKSKYAARLYPKLALIAGYDAPLRKPWIATPDEIGEFLGFPKKEGKFAVADLRRAVETAVEQINEHATRFEVELRVEREAGRGRPLAAFRFQVATYSSMQGKSLRAAKAVKLKKGDRLDVNVLLETLPEDRRPSWSAIGRAAGYTGIHTAEIMRCWTRHCEAAAALSGGEFDMSVFVEQVLAAKGVDQAFLRVVSRDHQHHGRDPYFAQPYTSALDEQDARDAAQQLRERLGRQVPVSHRRPGETWVEFEADEFGDVWEIGMMMSGGRPIRTSAKLAEAQAPGSPTRVVKPAGPPRPPAPKPRLFTADFMSVADIDVPVDHVEEPPFPMDETVLETSEEIPF